MVWWLSDAVDAQINQAQQQVQGKGKGKGKGNFMEMMMQMMMSKGGGKGQAWGQSATAQPVSWKSQLCQAYAKTHKENPSKETIIYTTEKTDDGHECSLSCDKFEDAYTGQGASIKAAQDAAAKAAVKAEFPTFFKEAQKVAKQTPSKEAVEMADPAATKLLPWRCQLNQAYARKHKTMVKNSIAYETSQVEPPKNTFVSSVSSENFKQAYTGESASSKRFAEDNAAMVAMEAEFPADYKASQAPKTEKGWRRNKRKEKEEVGEKDAKVKLNHSMMQLLQGSLTKETLQYTTTESNGTTTATLVITGLGDKKEFTGEASGASKQSKKDAELNACQAALEGLEEQIAAAQAVAAEKKTEKEAKKKSEWDVLLAKKKEEKAAEKAAKAVKA